METNKPSRPKESHIKPMTEGKLFVLIGTVIAVKALGVLRMCRVEGRVSLLMVGVSIFSLLPALSINWCCSLVRRTLTVVLQICLASAPLMAIIQTGYTYNEREELCQHSVKQFVN